MASDLLSAFDVPDDARDFLTETIDGGYLSPDEEARIRSERLLAKAQDFHALIDCATSIHRSRVIDASDLEGNDLLTSVWRVLQGTTKELNLNPWSETDRWIAKARLLEQEAAGCLQHIASPILSSKRRLQEDARANVIKRKRQPTVVTSHYWCPNSIRAHPSPGTITAFRPEHSRTEDSSTSPVRSQSTRPALPPPSISRSVSESEAAPTTIKQVEAIEDLTTHKPFTGQSNGHNSPYFASPPPSQKKNKAKRPPPGTISCIPFPPLTAGSFGLVQERFAHEPFWLLIVITFLIRTKGTAAVPVFLELKNKYPTPASIADIANAQDILDLIRHLGLAKNRLGILQKYARLFIDKPPQPGTLYRVRNYDARDVGMSQIGATRSLTGECDSEGVTPRRDDEGHAEAWEIGHMTQGKYAIDSWRIFCRDELLGRAKDWKGTGREPEFQPEWMRVKPDDKELRAYLRWMWMGEGWEWDPQTGEKKPLREEMMRAVNDGRVEYDDGGGLRIVPECGTEPIVG